MGRRQRRFCRHSGHHFYGACHHHLHGTVDGVDGFQYRNRRRWGLCNHFTIPGIRDRRRHRHSTLFFPGFFRSILYYWLCRALAQLFSDPFPDSGRLGHMGRSRGGVDKKRTIGLPGPIFRVGGHCGLVGQLFHRAVPAGGRAGLARRVCPERVLGNLRHFFPGGYRHPGRCQHVGRIANAAPQYHPRHLGGHRRRFGRICCDGLLVCPSGAGKRLTDQHVDYSRTLRLETGRRGRHTGRDTVVGPVDAGWSATHFGGVGSEPARSVSPVSRQTGSRQRAPQCSDGLFTVVAGGADGRQSGSAGPITDDVLLDDLRGDQLGCADRARQRHHQFPTPAAGLYPDTVGGIYRLHPDHAVDRQVVYFDHCRGGAVHI